MCPRSLTAVGAMVGISASLLFAPPARAQDWKWPTDRAIPVCWTNSVPPGDPLHREEVRKKAMVRRAVDTNFAQFSDLSFAGWGDCGSGGQDGIMIRIMYSETRGDVSLSGVSNPSSFVGRGAYRRMQNGPSPVEGMRLQFDAGDDYIFSSSMHEFGHALGFAHDHVRPNGTDFVCEALHPVVEEHSAGEHDVYLAAKDSIDSVMSYCPIFGQYWTSISENDVLGLQRHYGHGSSGAIYRAGQHTGSATCSGGSFADLLTGGCWSCPSGHQRSLNPDVRAANACVQPAGEQTARASDRGSPSGFPIATQCPGGAFLDIGKGRCYSCPSGFHRTAAPVTAGNACAKRVPERTAAARRTGSLGCSGGSFFDLTRAACFTCGTNHVRTAFPVDDPRACIRKDWGLSRQIMKRQ